MLSLGDGNLFFWVIIGVVAVTWIFYGYQSRASRDKLIASLAEKGQPIPRELLRDEDRPEDASRTARGSGIILICISLGMAVLLWGMTSPDSPFGDTITGLKWLPLAAVMPFAIGLGLLISSVGGKSRQK